MTNTLFQSGVSFQELHTATEGFNETCLIGLGRFGKVYKSRL